MPKTTDEDRDFALRLGNVLRELRAAARWTQEQAAERIGVPTGTLGRWERGDYTPKAYDLGRLFRAYEMVGADWRWFFEPPEVVVTNPVRDQLAQRDERRSEAAALAREDLGAELARSQDAATRQSARRRTRPA